MPSTREKLIELLNEADEWADHKCDELECETCPADKMKSNCVQQLMVDRLIANGVTVQKWIPVSERLPEKAGKYLVVTKSCFKKGEIYIQLMWYGAKSGFHISDPDFGCMKMNKYVTHWMPLPEPPKGE